RSLQYMWWSAWEARASLLYQVISLNIAHHTQKQATHTSRALSARRTGNVKHPCAAVDDDGKENHHEPAHGREYCHNRWLRIVVNHEQEPISYGPFPGLSTIRPPYIAYSSRADARILSGLMQSVQ